MGLYDIGGGVSSNVPDNDTALLDKPYDISGQWTPDVANQINEMLDMLFKSLRSVGGASFTTTGPATDGDLIQFSGTSGLLGKDAGVVAKNVVTGPASVSADGNVAVFSGTSGKVLKDSSQTISQIGAVTWVKVTLTNSQILSAHSVPVVLVAAPASGKAVVPFVWYMKEDSSGGAYSSNPTFNVQYSGNATALLTGITPNLNSGDKRWASGGLSGWGPLTFNPEATSVVVQSTADVTGGNSANSILIMLGYLVSS